jgi:hypothetical protein
MADKTNAERQRRYRQVRAKWHETNEYLRRELDIARRVIAKTPGCQAEYDRLRDEARAKRTAESEAEYQRAMAEIDELRRSL